MSHAAHHDHDHGHGHDHSHDHHDDKPKGFLNTVFEDTMGGFGIFWVVILMVSIFLILFLG